MPTFISTHNPFVFIDSTMLVHHSPSRSFPWQTHARHWNVLRREPFALLIRQRLRSPSQRVIGIKGCVNFWKQECRLGSRSSSDAIHHATRQSSNCGSKSVWAEQHKKYCEQHCSLQFLVICGNEVHSKLHRCFRERAWCVHPRSTIGG